MMVRGFIRFVAVILCFAMLAGCGASPQPDIEADVTRTVTAVASPIPTASATAVPSTSPPPTITPRPTNSPTPEPTATPSPTPTPSGPITILPTDPRISLIGRFDFTDPAAPTFDWPGVAIELAFSGPMLTLLLEDGNNLYNLTVDGVPSILRTRLGQTEYPLTAVGEGPHTVRLVKRTEFRGAVVTFRGVILPLGSTLEPPPSRLERRIEFVGDSITAGYGVEGDSPTCFYTSETQNIEQTYAAMIGRAVAAEVMFTAVSGIGVIRNYNEPDMISTTPMTVRYDRAITDNSAARWDFQRWRPDLVVINLGTNDFTTTPQPTQAIFVQAYIDLLNTIRAHYPFTPIIAMVPPIFQEPAAAYIQLAVTHMNTAQHDPHVHFVQTTNTLVSPADYGCDYHPNVSGQQKIADQLLPEIREIMGW